MCVEKFFEVCAGSFCLFFGGCFGFWLCVGCCLSAACMLFSVRMNVGWRAF